MIQILDALNNALYQINLTAEQVSSEAKRMAGDAQILSSGAVKQASAVEELSSDALRRYGTLGCKVLHFIRNNRKAFSGFMRIMRSRSLWMP